MKPFIQPYVITRHVVNISLDDIGKRLQGAPNYVRVGLPDNKTVEEARRASQEKRTRRKTR